MCVCVSSVETVSPALDASRLAVVLEALQSHKKSENTTDDAAVLCALLARSDYTSLVTSLISCWAFRVKMILL